jgi:hypothetical protein
MRQAGKPALRMPGKGETVFSKSGNLAYAPIVSVIVLNYNGLRYLRAGLKECLDSVIDCSYPRKEIIFVDNGSEDGSVAFVKEHYDGKITLIENSRNLGFSEGFNTGMRASNGEYFALLSNDMVVDRHWLEPVVALMESDKEVGLAGCKRLAYGSTKLLDGIGADLYLCGRVTSVGLEELDHGQYDANIYDLAFIGGVMIVRRKTVETAGMLDPELKLFSEDIDLCFRIRKAGYKVVYVYKSVLWHKASATFAGMSRDATARALIEFSRERNRIRTNIIYFRLPRLLSAFLIDLIWLVVDPNSTTKRMLLKGYLWNLQRIALTLRKRRRYAPSPPYGCKYGKHLSLRDPLARLLHRERRKVLRN